LRLRNVDIPCGVSTIDGRGDCRFQVADFGRRENVPVDLGQFLQPGRKAVVAARRAKIKERGHRHQVTRLQDFGGQETALHLPLAAALVHDGFPTNQAWPIHSNCSVAFVGGIVLRTIRMAPT
jgi:hypothetical protein